MLMMNANGLPREERVARLTVLVDPRKKAVFDELCAGKNLTPSQLVRSLIRRYIEERLGRPRQPGAAGASPPLPSRPAKRQRARRRVWFLAAQPRSPRE